MSYWDDACNDKAGCVVTPSQDDMESFIKLPIALNFCNNGSKIRELDVTLEIDQSELIDELMLTQETRERRVGVNKFKRFNLVSSWTNKFVADPNVRISGSVFFKCPGFVIERRFNLPLIALAPPLPMITPSLEAMREHVYDLPFSFRFQNRGGAPMRFEGISFTTNSNAENLLLEGWNRPAEYESGNGSTWRFVWKPTSEDVATTQVPDLRVEARLKFHGHKDIVLRLNLRPLDDSKDKGGIKVTPTSQECREDRELPLTFTIENQGKQSRKLTKCKLVVHQNLLKDCFQLEGPGNKRGVGIPPNHNVKYLIRFFPSSNIEVSRLGSVQLTLTLSFDGFIIRRTINVLPGQDLSHLNPIRPYEDLKRASRLFHAERERPEDPLATATDIKFKLLEVALNRDRENLLPLAQVWLQPSNYVSKLTAMVHLNEAEELDHMKGYDLLDQNLLPCGSFSCFGKRQFRYKFFVQGLVEKRPSVVYGDDVLIREGGNDEGRAMIGSVREVGLDYIVVHVVRHIPWKVVDVRFSSSRFCVLMQHAAIKAVTQQTLKRLFPNEGVLGVNEKASRSWIQSQTNLNTKQCESVYNLLNRCVPGRMSPMILFGPPGTGKTTTLVAGVTLLLKLRIPGTKVFISAQNNAACDYFCDKLLQSLAKHGMNDRYVIRYLSKSQAEQMHQNQNDSSVTSRVREVSGQHSLKTMMSADVIIATCSVAGKLKEVKDLFFSHVIVDEAGQVSEPEILSTLTFPPMANAQWILGGDPKQLGPIIQSRECMRWGMDKPLLERLCDMSSYHLSTRPDNIVRLDQSYRCHPSLLRVSSELFYDGKLFSQEIQNRSSLLPWAKSKTKSINPSPMVVYDLPGAEMREGNSPSWFNKAEVIASVDVAVSLIKQAGVKPEEIAVIAPYVQQVKKIKAHLNHVQTLNNNSNFNLNHVKVGTVELFQGSESRVVIVTTVRSSLIHVQTDVEHNIGFLRNPKRFNVSITRARELLVVVCDAQALSADPCWSRLLDAAKRDGGFVPRASFQP